VVQNQYRRQGSAESHGTRLHTRVDRYADVSTPDA